MRLNGAMIAERAIPYTTRHSVLTKCLSTPVKSTEHSFSHYLQIFAAVFLLFV